MKKTNYITGPGGVSAGKAGSEVLRAGEQLHTLWVALDEVAETVFCSDDEGNLVS